MYIYIYIYTYILLYVLVKLPTPDEALFKGLQGVVRIQRGVSVSRGPADRNHYSCSHTLLTRKSQNSGSWNYTMLYRLHYTILWYTTLYAVYYILCNMYYVLDTPLYTIYYMPYTIYHILHTIPTPKGRCTSATPARRWTSAPTGPTALVPGLVFPSKISPSEHSIS